MPWGNLNGIRISGQLMRFSTSLNLVEKNWNKVISTGKELQHPQYQRQGKEQQVTTLLGPFQCSESVINQGRGSAELQIQVRVLADIDTIQGLYFGVALPEKDYVPDHAGKEPGGKQTWDPARLGRDSGWLRTQVRTFSLAGTSRKFNLRLETLSSVYALPDTGKANGIIRLYFPLGTGPFKKGAEFGRKFRIQVSGKIDHRPITLKLDTLDQGRSFDGLGGNFRLQNPGEDPEVIDYCLKNLRVAWGRVELPWSQWQPDPDSDPLLMAKQGRLNPHVLASMEMARRLSKRNIPIILTVWSPPAWAVTGMLHPGKSPSGVWGNPLNETETPLIYRSISEYLLYLRDHYGVEVSDFSFNESDLGIDIRQTGPQQDALIRGLGAYFKSRGLKTKLLLGDNSDATTYSFIEPAMADPKARPFMGAVSFHSWRGWDTPTLQQWANAAKKLKLPLIVAEGSIDAAAWQYPAYFSEPTYALEEISLYIKLLAVCQPLSILQWQLTSDYSLLSGGGIYGEQGPLQPTQRFWNLKQLSITPKGLFHLPVQSDRPDITCAALGNRATDQYAFHMVNKGAARRVHLVGLPSGLRSLSFYITNKKEEMKKLGPLQVNDHQASFLLPSRSFVSLISN